MVAKFYSRYGISAPPMRNQSLYQTVLDVMDSVPIPRTPVAPSLAPSGASRTPARKVGSSVAVQLQRVSKTETGIKVLMRLEEVPAEGRPGAEALAAALPSA